MRNGRKQSVLFPSHGVLELQIETSQLIEALQWFLPDFNRKCSPLYSTLECYPSALVFSPILSHSRSPLHLSFLPPDIKCGLFSPILPQSLTVSMFVHMLFLLCEMPFLLSFMANSYSSFIAWGHPSLSLTSEFELPHPITALFTLCCLAPAWTL